MRTRNKSQRKRSPGLASPGFTLIEMAISMIILGIIIAPLFVIMGQQREHKIVEDSTTINDEILASLDIYLKINGYYPCPADPAAGPQDLLGVFGEGAGTNTANCTAAINKAAPAPFGGGQVYVGALPVKQLGLPYRFAGNRYGWKYTYAVTANLTRATAFDNIGRIRVNDALGNQLNNTGIQFLVIDPGRDGKGARNIFGGPAQPCPAGQLDSGNCNNANALFVQASHNEDPASAAFFDDTVLYSASAPDNTFWLAQKVPIVGDTAKLDIFNKNVGNVGIGTTSLNPPTSQLQVTGGDMQIQANPAGGGNLNADKNVTSLQNIKASRNITAGQNVVGQSFQ